MVDGMVCAVCGARGWLVLAPFWAEFQFRKDLFRCNDAKGFHHQSHCAKPHAVVVLLRCEA